MFNIIKEIKEAISIYESTEKNGQDKNELIDTIKQLLDQLKHERKTVHEFIHFLKHTILYNRFFSVEEIEKNISEFLGFKVKLEKRKRGAYVDFRLGLNLRLEDEDGPDLYLDVFYLIDNDNNFFITEISVDFEFDREDIDYDSYIIDIDQ